MADVAFLLLIFFLVTTETAITLQSNELLLLKVQWYLALAYLELENISAPKDMLTLIAANKIESNYKLKAQTLLKEINK